jgi:hypothetical protein
MEGSDPRDMGIPLGALEGISRISSALGLDQLGFLVFLLLAGFDWE